MVNWIAPNLGTAPYSSASLSDDVCLVDVRAMVDRGGNNAPLVKQYVDAAVEGLRSGRRVLVCCDHGISRSNAIAAAALSVHAGIEFDEAVQQVLAATGSAEIRVDVLAAVRAAVFPDQDAKGRAPDVWLLTGASGYLGGALLSACPPAVQIIAPARSELDLLGGAANLDLLIKQYGVSRVLHFASPRITNTNTALGQSLTMLRNVLDACVVNDVSVFLPCRWEVFAGYRGSTLAADEMTALRPDGTLGESKYLASLLVRQFEQRHRLRVTLLRSALVYGGHSAPNFLKSFIKRALSGQAPVTHRYENGAPLLDMLYVDDWVAAAWALLSGGLSGVFHCGAGLISTAEVARIVVEVCGMSGEAREVEIAGQAAAVALNSDKLRRDLGWQPTTGPHAGIGAYVNAQVAQRR